MSVLILTVIFALLNLPAVYRITSGTSECFSVQGHVAHTVLFFVASVLIMAFNNVLKPRERRLSVYELIKSGFCGTMLFYILSDQKTYKLVAGRFGEVVTTNQGCPSNIGVLIHSVVFLSVKSLLML